MKCSYRYCFCTVEEEEDYCSGKCKSSDRSERPSETCRCDHERCDADAEDEDDDDDEEDEDDDCCEDSEDVGEDEHAIEK